MIRPANDPAAISFDGIPRVAHSAIRSAPDSWNRWLEFCEKIQDDDFEMTCEEGAEFFSMVATLVQLGVPFSADFVFRVDEMRQAAMNHPHGVSFLEDDTDSDIDGVDDEDGGDDGDNDAGDSHIEDGFCRPVLDRSTPESAAACDKWYKENHHFDSENPPKTLPWLIKPQPANVVFPEPEFQLEARCNPTK